MVTANQPANPIGLGGHDGALARVQVGGPGARGQTCRGTGVLVLLARPQDLARHGARERDTSRARTSDAAPRWARRCCPGAAWRLAPGWPEPECSGGRMPPGIAGVQIRYTTGTPRRGDYCSGPTSAVPNRRGEYQPGGSGPRKTLPMPLRSCFEARNAAEIRNP